MSSQPDPTVKPESRNSKLARLARFGAGISNVGLRFSSFVSRIPGRLLLWGAGLLLLAGWLHERDARVRQAVELRQLEKQTAAEVATLEARAVAAAREANERNARVIQGLEGRRRKLVREADELRERLRALDEKGQLRVGQVATLPASELVSQVAARLGPDSPGARDQGPGARERTSSAFDSSSPTLDAGDRRAASQDSGVGNKPFAGPQPRARSPVSSAPSPEPPVPSPAVTVREPGLRRIETAFVELEACREQETVRSQQVANCLEQVETSAGIAETQAASLEKLNEALAAQEQVRAQREAMHRAELRAARGSWRRRLGRALTYVVLGVGLGVAAR